MSEKIYGKLGIYGGTFDPVHEGHIRAAVAFYDELALDTLLIMPALIPPHKAAEAESPADRLEMLRIAFEGCGRNIVISDYELSRGGISYTYLTLEHFAPLCDKLYLLCGTDMFVTLDKWREPDTIFRLCTPVLVRRESGASGDDTESAMRRYVSAYGVSCPTVPCEPFEASSTEARELLSRSGDARGLVPERVVRYIRDKGLYHVADRLKKGSDRIRAELPLHHDAKRIPHVLGVERAMRKLSAAYGLGVYDTELGAVAALLHDVTKKETPEWHIGYLRAHGIEPDLDTVLSPKTLHQLTGAIMARELYPDVADEKVAQAISRHTTGSPDMTLFDKLLFLSDYIEDTRTFESCVRLREYFEKKSAETDPETALDKTMLRAYRFMLTELVDEKKHIHSMTVAAYNAALKGGNNV